MNERARRLAFIQSLTERELAIFCIGLRVAAGANYPDPMSSGEPCSTKRKFKR